MMPPIRVKSVAQILLTRIMMATAITATPALAIFAATADSTCHIIGRMTESALSVNAVNAARSLHLAMRMDCAMIAMRSLKYVLAAMFIQCIRTDFAIGANRIRNLSAVFAARVSFALFRTVTFAMIAEVRAEP